VYFSLIVFLFTGSTQLSSLGRSPLIIKKNVAKALFKYPQPDIAIKLIQGPFGNNRNW
jgi:hypothetical protein